MTTSALLEKTIEKALQKIQGTKTKELCRYLPPQGGAGHMHHFTFEKLKKNDPSQLEALLEKFIFQPTHPKKIAPKQRAPRGTRKQKQLIFNREELSCLIEMADKSGYRDIVAKLRPHGSITKLKKSLIDSIKQNNVDHSLWRQYTELVASKS